MSHQRGEKLYDLTASEGSDGVYEGIDFFTVYINTELDKNTIKPINLISLITIQDVAYIETIVIPDKSCQVEFSFMYTIDGKYSVESEPLFMTIHVPLYNDKLIENMLYYSIDVHYLNDDPEIGNDIRYDEKKFIDEIYLNHREGYW